MENYSTLSRDKTFRKRTYIVFFSIVLGIIALYGLVFSAENFLGGTQPGGVSGSSYATIQSGTRAWSELLFNNGYEVTRDRGRATLPELESDSEVYSSSIETLGLNRKTQTVVILEGALPSDEQKELENFLTDGGRLITDNPYILDQLLQDKIQVNVEGYTSFTTPNNAIEGLEDISTVAGSEVGSLLIEESNQQTPILVPGNSTDDFGPDRKVLAGAGLYRFGAGDIVALPDSGIVSNALLDKNDNALFSLLIAGSRESGVTFIEGVHGYNDATGFAGMPMNWRVAIVGLFLAFVIFAAAQGRRFGVGEEPDRNLGPRRIYFAYALTQAIKKSKK